MPLPDVAELVARSTRTQDRKNPAEELKAKLHKLVDSGVPPHLTEKKAERIFWKMFAALGLRVQEPEPPSEDLTAFLEIPAAQIKKMGEEELRELIRSLGLGAKLRGRLPEGVTRKQKYVEILEGKRAELEGASGAQAASTRRRA